MYHGVKSRFLQPTAVASFQPEGQAYYIYAEMKHLFFQTAVLLDAVLVATQCQLRRPHVTCIDLLKLADDRLRLLTALKPW
jgi:hypothetical protein